MGVIGKKIVSNSVILLFSLVSARMLRFILVIFSARILGDVDYGKFSFAIAFTSLFLILIDVGVHQLLVRELARKPEKIKEYLGNTLTIKIVLAFVTLALISAIVNLTDKPKEVILTVMIIGGFQVVFSFTEYLKAVFQAFQKMIYDAIATILLALLTVGFGIAALVTNGSFIDLALMYFLSSIITLAVCIIITHRKFAPIKLNFDWSLIRFFLKEGFPFGILHFFSMVYIYISTVILSFLVNDEVVGWYNASYRLIFIMLFIPQATMKAIFPVLSKYHENAINQFKRLFEKAFKAMFVVGVSMAFSFYLLADRIILLVYGSEYVNAAQIIKVMVWSAAFVFMMKTMTHTTRLPTARGTLLKS